MRKIESYKLKCGERAPFFRFVENNGFCIMDNAFFGEQTIDIYSNEAFKTTPDAERAEADAGIFDRRRGVLEVYTKELSRAVQKYIDKTASASDSSPAQEAQSAGSPSV